MGKYYNLQHSANDDAVPFSSVHECAGGSEIEMPLRWEWRRQPNALPDALPEVVIPNPDISTDGIQTDASDVVLLSTSRHWAIGAEREALNDAVTLVDSLLQLSSCPRRRWLNGVDVILRQREARMRADDSSAAAVRALPERRSTESLCLRASWDDLCRRRSLVNADSDAALVGSGRLRRQSAAYGRPHSRWRQRDAGENETHGLGHSQSDSSEIFKRLAGPPINLAAAYDDLLTTTTGSRASLRPHVRSILDHTVGKLSTSVSWQDLSDCSIAMSNESEEPRVCRNMVLDAGICRRESSTTNIAETSVESVLLALPTHVDRSAGASKVDTSIATDTGSSDDIQEIVRNQLECPVCLDYLTPPIKQCANGHCVCSACSPRLAHCATCRASFISTSNIVLENLVRSICFPCRYKDAGCAEVLKMEQRPAHEEICPYRPRRCPTACCDWQGLPGQLKAHITSTHQHHNMELGELKEFCFCVDRNDGVPTIVHDEQFVIFIGSEMFVFESHYDLWRSKFFAELRHVNPDMRTSASPVDPNKHFAYDVELYTRNKSTHLKLRNVLDDSTRQSATAIKIDLDVFNQFVVNGVYILHLRIVSVDMDEPS